MEEENHKKDAPPIKMKAADTLNNNMDTSANKQDIIGANSFLKRDGERPDKIQCSVCEKRFDNITEYTHHLNMHIQGHSKQNILASKCTKMTEKYVEHRQKSVKEPAGRCKQKDKPFSCSLCRKSYKTKRFCDKHFLVTHKNVETCSICQKQFAKKSELRKHFNIFHLKLKPFSCTLCDKSFTEKGSLTMHINFHKKRRDKLEKEWKLDSDPNLETCSVCQKQFKSKLTLEMHINSAHKELKLFACTMCKKSFISPEYLTQHTDLAHKNAETCTVCQKQFNARLTLEKHMKAVHGEFKVFLCTLCDKTFVQKGILSQHINAVHRKLKPFTCKSCNKSFSRKSSLSEHIAAIHNKSFSCGLCDKSFATKQTLARHVDALHTKINPFSCTLCDQSFARKAHLSEHVNNVHYKLKPFSCTLCDKSFGYKRKLNLHLKTVHSNRKPFSCTLCKISFDRENNLMTHINSIHNGSGADFQISHNKEKSFPSTRCDQRLPNIGTQTTRIDAVNKEHVVHEDKNGEILAKSLSQHGGNGENKIMPLAEGNCVEVNDTCIFPNTDDHTESANEWKE